jgi:predicted transcriptional regulator|tara:strand:+ start:315 stop:980 length:666 start_codon:yes stop_codon:yes gene_type:complete
MRVSGDSGDHGLEGTSFRELRLLEEVELTPDVSQRKLAGNVGIALGVVNVLVKSLVTKGYIRATRLGWRRWTYNLTPAGVARKVQLTANYVDQFLGHYRRVRDLVREALDAAQIGPESTVAIYGTTEMGELMFLVLRKSGVQRVVFLDESGSGEYLGALVKSPNNIDPDEYAKVLVAYPNDVESRRQNLVNAGVCPDSIITLLDPPELAAANKITEATDHC